MDLELTEGQALLPGQAQLVPGQQLGHLAAGHQALHLAR